MHSCSKFTNIDVYRYDTLVIRAGLLQNLEEETRINTYLVKEKVPNEIADKKRAIQELQKVVLEPAMGQSDLDAILLKVVYFIFVLSLTSVFVIVARNKSLILERNGGLDLETNNCILFLAFILLLLVIQRSWKRNREYYYFLKFRYF